MKEKQTDKASLSEMSASVHHGADKLGSRMQNLYRAPTAGHSNALQFGGNADRFAEPESKSYGQYLFGENYADPALADGEPGAPTANWSSYTGSRIVVRLFSRGLMGATLYTAAHRWIPGQLKGYTSTGAFDKSKPLQWLARGFDIGYGKPIQAYVRQYYRWMGKSAEEVEKFAKESTTFRTKRNFGTDLNPEMGRSIGAEIVGMTTDFAAGSTGDAWGRNISNMLDPNFRNSWERDDGSIDLKDFAKSNARSAWRIFSKNQGEDWAVALPYVYQMRFQRTAINKLFRGFSLSSDHQLNGGSWRVNEKGDILGSYAAAGALDLQARFTGYNIFTLMYRDMYDHVANFIHNGPRASSLAPEERSGVPFVDSVFRGARYVAKSAIKATIYMTPAVPFFWVTRTPQTKAHGMQIVVPSDHSPITHTAVHTPEYPFARQHTRGVLDRTLNPFGEACYKTAKGINKAARALGASKASTQMGYGVDFPRTWTEDFVNASASYTPYMIAKAETALRWDRPKDKDGLNNMDRSIYRFIDGISRLNIGEVAGGLRDMREEMIRPPSNRNIYEKQKQFAKNKGEEPDTNVEQVSDEKTLKSPHKGQEAPAQADANWQNKHLHEQFMQSPYPDQGTTIH